MNSVLCPYCKKGTIREPIGFCSKTLMYYPPKYDANGVNINPDRNTISQEYYCSACADYYVVQGNHHDGFEAYESINNKRLTAERKTKCAKDRERWTREAREKERRWRLFYSAVIATAAVACYLVRF